MPAIQFQRFQQQAAALAVEIPWPERFVRRLLELLEFYADRTQRPGQAGRPAALIHSYRTPPQLVRELSRSLREPLRSDPQQAGLILDALWQEVSLETRRLALLLAGDCLPPDETLAARLRSWMHASLDEELVENMLAGGMAALRQHNPALALALGEEWLAGKDLGVRQAGLRALAELAIEPGYQNQPAILRAITAVTRQAPADARPELLLAIGALAQRSPAETAGFLAQQYQREPSNGLRLLIRLSLPSFTEEQQAWLKAQIKTG